MMYKSESNRVAPPKTFQGQRSGELIVDDPGPYYKQGSMARHVYVICDCGNEFYTREQNIIKGLSTRCMGCKNKRQSQILRKDHSPWNTWMNRYVQNARTRGIDFELTREQLIAICSLPCRYCGDLPTLRTFQYGNTVEANGIDRRDSSKGYTVENSVPCCTDCNHMKWDMTEDQFLARVTQILEFGLRK